MCLIHVLYWAGLTTLKKLMSCIQQTYMNHFHIHATMSSMMSVWCHCQIIVGKEKVGKVCLYGESCTKYATCDPCTIPIIIIKTSKVNQRCTCLGEVIPNIPQQAIHAQFLSAWLKWARWIILRKGKQKVILIILFIVTTHQTSYRIDPQQLNIMLQLLHPYNGWLKH